VSLILACFRLHTELCCTDGWRDAIDRIDPEFMPNLERAVATMDFSKCFDKVSSEKTKKGKKVLSPIIMNQHFVSELEPLGYRELSSDNFYPETFADAKRLRDVPHLEREEFLAREAIPHTCGSIEGDFSRNGLLLEVQFGKYPFVDWDIDKSIEFFKRRRLKGGCVLVPMRSTQALMSTGPANWQTAMGMFAEKRLDETLDFPFALIGLETDLSGKLPKGVKRPKPQNIINQFSLRL
jgi:hypothetical protein